MRKHKILLALIMSLVLIMTSMPVIQAATAASGQLTVTPRPEVTISIDGVTGQYSDVPIIVNDRLLLPLRAVLNNLGVTDDNITWNQSDRSITVKKGTSIIRLSIDSNQATVNNESVTIDAPAMLYNSRTYIPTRFVAQSLGMLVFWDGDHKKVIIRDKAAFDETKVLLDKINAAMVGAKRVKQDVSIKITKSINNSKPSSFLDYQCQSAIDREKQQRYVNASLTTGGSAKQDYEIYVGGKMMYARTAGMTQWQPQELGQGIMNKYYDFTTLFVDDLLCAEMIQTKSANAEEIVLTGAVYRDTFINDVSGGMTSFGGEYDKVAVEIVVDKATSRIKTVHMTGTRTTQNTAGQSELTTAEATKIFSEYDGTFSIAIPENIK